MCTFNTLIFADEMAAAEQLLRATRREWTWPSCRTWDLPADPPALAGLPIHASTQMTVTSRRARSLPGSWAAAVVLARESSIREIEKIGRRCRSRRWRFSCTARCAWRIPVNA